MKGRILAVDPGEKRIGIAVSDPTASIASPLTVVGHVQMDEDCRKILHLAEQYEVVLIIVGAALGSEGEETRQARHSKKLADTLEELGEIPVCLWDESGSTKNAQKMRINLGAKKKDRTGHMDDRAAAFILQSYLDEKSRLEFE